MNIDKFRFENMNELEDLEKAAVNSFREVYKPGTSKRHAREEHNRMLREEAKKNGLSDEEIGKMRRKESPYIHSISTHRQYTEECCRFVCWVKVKHPEAKKLKYCFKIGYAREYIQMLIDNGYSPSTIAKRTSALAKIFRVSASDIHDNRPPRLYSQFTRSRSYNEVSYKNDLDTYGIIAEIAYMTGVRECELEEIVPECFYEENGKVKLHLAGKLQNTKNGMSRDVPIIDKNQARIKEILSTIEPSQKICPTVPDRLDVHGIRSLYATALYNSIARDIKDIEGERITLKRPKRDSRTGKLRHTAPVIYRRKDGACFDRAALLVVAEALGHSREDVVVHSYLR